jgi:energy-coupling factor transporter ATP-binding protein EcfA2
VSRDPGLAAAAARLADVSFVYRDREGPALSQVNLEVAPGECVAVLGPSGAGKSTLCRVLNGLIPHFQHGEFAGQATVFGQDTRQARVPELARTVGLVFQEFESQLFATSVEMEVAFAPESFGISPEAIRTRINDCLAAVGLAGYERRRPAALSGGEKQRLAIAAVLAGGPKLLVLDEATTDLDPVGKRQVLDVLRPLTTGPRAARPSTILFVTSEPEEAAIADRVVVIESGRIAADGAAGSVLSSASWLEAHGVRPPDTAALCAALGLTARPLSAADAARVLTEAGFTVDSAARRQLREPGPLSKSPRQPAGDPLIEVSGLSYTYRDGPRALSDVELAIRQGEFVALAGPNGSGKTTLAKHLNRLLEPTSGEVRVAGRSTRAQSHRQLAEKIGYVFQNPDHQIFADTIASEVAFGPRNAGLPGPEVGARVAEALEAVGLRGREGEDPFALTKGERQRVAVASMLAARPETMIFDEPTTGLDYRESRGMMNLIRDLHQAGHTIIIITHTMWVICEYADRLVLMREGHITADAPVRDVMGRPDLLAQASLTAPPVAELGARLGYPFRSVAEAARLLKRSARA